MKIEERLKNDQEKAGLFSDYMYIEESDTLITSEVMRTVYVAVKHMGTSFNSIEHMIDVQEIHGVDHRELKLDGAIGHFAEPL